MHRNLKALPRSGRRWSVAGLGRRRHGWSRVPELRWSLSGAGLRRGRLLPPARRSDTRPLAGTRYTRSSRTRRIPGTLAALQGPSTGCRRRPGRARGGSSRRRTDTVGDDDSSTTMLHPRMTLVPRSPCTHGVTENIRHLRRLCWKRFMCYRCPLTLCLTLH